MSKKIVDEYSLTPFEKFLMYEFPTSRNRIKSIFKFKSEARIIKPFFFIKGTAALLFFPLAVLDILSFKAFWGFFFIVCTVSQLTKYIFLLRNAKRLKATEEVQILLTDREENNRISRRINIIKWNCIITPLAVIAVIAGILILR